MCVNIIQHKNIFLFGLCLSECACMYVCITVFEKSIKFYNDYTNATFAFNALAS